MIQLDWAPAITRPLRVARFYLSEAVKDTIVPSKKTGRRWRQPIAFQHNSSMHRQYRSSPGIILAGFKALCGCHPSKPGSPKYPDEPGKLVAS